MNFGDPRLPERFWSKVQPCPMSGCFIWTGTAPNGYGQINWRCEDGRFRRVSVHRLAVETAQGAIPTGMTVDHACPGTPNKLCVNPAHLEVVTNQENIRRYWERNPHTHCKNGHDIAVVGTYANGGKHRGRRCRACQSIQNARYAGHRERLWSPKRSHELIPHGAADLRRSA